MPSSTPLARQARESALVSVALAVGAADKDISLHPMEGDDDHTLALAALHHTTMRWTGVKLATTASADSVLRLVDDIRASLASPPAPADPLTSHAAIDRDLTPAEVAFRDTLRGMGSYIVHPGLGGVLRVYAVFGGGQPRVWMPVAVGNTTPADVHRILSEAAARLNAPPAPALVPSERAAAWAADFRSEGFGVQIRGGDHLRVETPGRGDYGVHVYVEADAPMPPAEIGDKLRILRNTILHAPKLTDAERAFDARLHKTYPSALTTRLGDARRVAFLPLPPPYSDRYVAASTDFLPHGMVYMEAEAKAAEVADALKRHYEAALRVPTPTQDAFIKGVLALNPPEDEDGGASAKDGTLSAYPAEDGRVHVVLAADDDMVEVSMFAQPRWAKPSRIVRYLRGDLKDLLDGRAARVRASEDAKVVQALRQGLDKAGLDFVTLHVLADYAPSLTRVLARSTATGRSLIVDVLRGCGVSNRDALVEQIQVALAPKEWDTDTEYVTRREIAEDPTAAFAPWKWTPPTADGALGRWTHPSGAVVSRSADGVWTIRGGALPRNGARTSNSAYDLMRLVGFKGTPPTPPATTDADCPAGPTSPDPDDSYYSDFLMRLATVGGAIVCTDALSAAEITKARADGRMIVRPSGIGFVHLPKGIP